MKITGIYNVKGYAYVKVEENVLLCIGSIEEARKAAPEQLAEMIYGARATCKFNEIDEIDVEVEDQKIN